MNAIDSSALRAHYRAFLRDDRVLLTGHSHQAWPDVARDAQLRAFDDAATFVDDKWDAAFEAAEAVRRGIAQRIGAEAGEIALGSSTHELVARFLSALDLRRRPHLVTTRGEFHSMHRQLSRLAEEGVEVTWVDPAPLDSLAERLASVVRDDTAAVLASSVLFETSSVVPNLAHVTAVAARHGAAFLVDAYHAFGVVPFTVDALGGDEVFVVAGGYKYAQWGEGNCFLRVPPSSTLRPVYTGWFSDFASLGDARDGRAVSYGTRGAERFAGSTYDPTSHYRARAVIDFFDAQALDLPRLRARSLAQTTRLFELLDGLDIATPRTPELRGGFVAVRLADADGVRRALLTQGIHTDSRGPMLRLGPAPYTTDAELEHAARALRTLVLR